MRTHGSILCLLLATVLCAAAPGCGDAGPGARPEAAARPAVPGPEADAAATAPGNAPPQILSIEFEPEAPQPGDRLRARVEARDPDGDRVFFDYAWLVDGQPLGGDDPRVTLTGTAKGQTVELTVTPSDGKLEGRPDTESVEIANRAPEVVGLALEPGTELFAGTPLVVRPDGRDLDGDGIRYRYEWEVNGRSLREEGPVLETRRMRRGDEVRVRVIASDGENESVREGPSIRIVNAPPRFTSRPPGDMPDGRFRYLVTARDPDGDLALQFRLAEAPDGMRIDPLSGEIRWEPDASQTGTHSITVIADDLQGGQSQQVFEVNISAPDGTPAALAP